MPDPNIPARYQLNKHSADALRRGHPWVNRRSMSSAVQAFAAGQIVEFFGPDNQPLGFGIYEPLGSVGIRKLGGLDFPALIAESAAKRKPVDAFRLVNGEADGLPGLTIDIFHNVVVIQPYLQFWTERAPMLAEAVRAAAPQADTVWMRPPRAGDEIVALYGAEPFEPVEFQTEGFKGLAYPRSGHKTGFYLDLRLARRKLMKLAPGKSILNIFANSGSMSVAALTAGAKSVRSVEILPRMREQARAMYQINGLPWDDANWISESARHVLEADETAPADLIILDPPDMCQKKEDVERAIRGWRRLLFSAAGKLNPGGLILAINCSRRIHGRWRPTKGWRAADHGGLPPDHTTSAAFREGHYLDWWVLRPDSARVAASEPEK